VTATRWIIELTAEDAERLDAENGRGHLFVLHCGAQQATPLSVTEARDPS
jgi:hypothetical protein